MDLIRVLRIDLGEAKPLKRARVLDQVRAESGVAKPRRPAGTWKTGPSNQG